MRTEIILLNGMKINDDKRVKIDLMALKGVSGCIIDSYTNTIEIDFDQNKISLQIIHKTIEQLGVTVITEKNRRCWSC